MAVVWVGGRFHASDLVGLCPGCPGRLPMGWTPPDGIDVPEWGVDDTT
jgi:hypothetical protein